MVKPNFTHSHNRYYQLMLITGGQPPTFEQFKQVFAPHSPVKDISELPQCSFLISIYHAIHRLYPIATLPEIDFINYCLNLLEDTPEANDELRTLLGLRLGILVAQQKNKRRLQPRRR